MQRSFAEYDGFRKQRKVTRREAFLGEMDRVVPWRRFESLIEPHYPVAGNGRKGKPSLKAGHTWVEINNPRSRASRCLPRQG
jgi:hypothetical protein